MKSWDSEEATFAWLTGIFEGDGSLNTRNGRTYIGIDVTDEDIVRTLQLRFGGKVYGPSYKNAKGSMNVKPMWQWRLHTQKDVWPILNGMYPHLSERRRERINQARIAYANRPLKGRASVNHALSGLKDEENEVV